MSLYDKILFYGASLCVLSIVFYPCAMSNMIDYSVFPLSLTIVHGCLAHLSVHHSHGLVRESWAVVTTLESFGLNLVFVVFGLPCLVCDPLDLDHILNLELLLRYFLFSTSFI